MKPRTSQLAQTGAATGQALVWDGSSWLPGDVVNTDSTHSFAGDGTTPLSKFATFAAQVAVHGAVNAIVGMAINDTAASTTAFPAGITGYSRVDNAGNQGFGVFGRADLYAAGVATNEFNAFNYKGAPTGNFPPNRAIGTTETNPVVLTVASGGSFASAIGIHIVKEGSSPQQMLCGVYINPDACSTYGIFVDGTSTSSAGTGLLVKTKTSGIGIEIDCPTGQSVDAFRMLLNGTVQASLTSSGGLVLTTNGAGGTNDALRLRSNAHDASKSFRVTDSAGDLQILNKAFSAVIMTLTDAGALTVTGGLAFAPATTTTAPGAGGAGALPATPLGYATVTINGTARKVAYY